MMMYRLASPRRRPMRGLLRPALAPVGLALVACASPGPAPVTYVLGTPAALTGGIERLAGRPVVEVKPVFVPDYLDVSDILVRRGANVVAPSPTGRWGERLSVGVTRALVAGLTRLRPDLVVTAVPPIEGPSRQVLVDIGTFEPRDDGRVVLVARWHMLDGSGRDTLADERLSMTGAIRGPGDEELVAAMTRLVGELAARIAAGPLPPNRRAGASARRVVRGE